MNTLRVGANDQSSRDNNGLINLKTELREMRLAFSYIEIKRAMKRLHKRIHKNGMK